MTKAQRRKIIYTACELLENKRGYYSCMVLHAEDSLHHFGTQTLREEYKFFYDMYDSYWPGLKYYLKYHRLEEKDYSQRIIMLLLFLEIGLEEIGEA